MSKNRLYIKLIGAQRWRDCRNRQLRLHPLCQICEQEGQTDVMVKMPMGDKNRIHDQIFLMDLIQNYDWIKRGIDDNRVMRLILLDQDYIVVQRTG